ncbi:chromosome partitioning protein ParB [Treponema phagedenis]|uniref:Chromosome partitioning protein ParB n=1 Tax=Treponema phagedenis TaxID=162 RepID=A0A0B7GSB4_TREPH|nr:ParB N-terminal domain-containing protein [Treponema phagedenis]NVP23161.1 ParB N-terminal domain-containing protein [Treponema phagedenis]NVP25625.1 ParB N-terminal domain-containing protein [Treponema phagedenis]QEJ95426.1 chromosome partitioning protein ParB [Treponema phagedenis]QEJ98031.1 chromosome partitioning protein ParB [Treponema phagedenis]QEK01280.1 chromosome partitioning protein ParB [Treponema phagedenis]
MQVAINDIKVKKRVRKEVDNIEKLAESMKQYGLLNPIILTGDFVLIAGERRLRAAKLLGWQTIEATIFDIENKIHALEIEIEENVQRQDFNDEDLSDAFAQLEKLKNPNVFVRIWETIRSFFKNLFNKEK